MSATEDTGGTNTKEPSHPDSSHEQKPSEPEKEVFLDIFAHKVEPSTDEHHHDNHHHGNHHHAHHDNHHHAHHDDHHHAHHDAHNEHTHVMVDKPFHHHTSRRPTSWVAPAIMATICCFFPIGIIAIYFAVRATQKQDEGDFRGAKETTLTARRLTIITVAAGMMLYLSGILFKVLHLDHK